MVCWLSQSRGNTIVDFIYLLVLFLPLVTKEATEALGNFSNTAVAQHKLNLLGDRGWQPRHEVV
jgi:hypothetical protein